jgi:hypothetical protein
VGNDPTSAGVDWSLLCTGGANCGTLAPLHTASGAAATYTPPASISGNSQTFTIEAFATADHSQNLVTSMTVTGFAAVLKGTYAFQTRGVNVNGAYQLAGVIILDGNGGVTRGEQTHSDSLLSISDLISGGSYNIGPDGRGTLTLNTADPNIGQLGVENFSLVFLSSSQALLAILDNPNFQSSSESSSGTLDLQTSKAAPTGGYAFAVSGTDVSSQPMAMGGVLNLDSPGTISGAGSVADQDDANVVSANATVSGTVSKADPYGAITFNLTASFATNPFQFTGYIVDATHINLIESDNNGSGAGVGSTAGLAIAQGSATGKFISNTSFAGDYVFNVLGEDLSGIPTSLASVGKFTADSSGNMSNGYDDEFLAGLFLEIGDSFTGTYTLDPAGTGRADSNVTFTNNGAGPELIFYLTGNGNPPLLLAADVNLGSLGSGAAYGQTPPFTFDGRYGLYFTQSSFGSEDDGTAQIAVDGTAKTLSGIVDSTLFLTPQPNTPLTGIFGTIPITGLFGGSMTNTFFPSPGNPPNTLALDFYLIDSTHGFFIETDSVSSGDLFFGYISARTPVCGSCQ